MAKNNKKNVNTLNEEKLGNVSGGNIGESIKKLMKERSEPQPQWKASGYKSRGDLERDLFGRGKPTFGILELNDVALSNISGGRTQLTPEQKASILDELKKDDGGMGYAKKCLEYDVKPDTSKLSQFVKDQLGL